MKMRMVVVCCAALALAVGVATAAAGGGNSEAAKKCQKGGYKNWVRADGSAFKNEGDCVSYAAKGGVLTSPKTQPQLDCESLGGTFSTNPADNLTGISGFTFLWACNGLPNPGTAFVPLLNACADDVGSGVPFVFGSGTTTAEPNLSCLKA